MEAPMSETEAWGLDDNNLTDAWPSTCTLGPTECGLLAR